jgi:hypothetical protein
MRLRFTLIALLTGLAAAPAQAAVEERVVVVAVDRFATCATTEGESVTDEDRAAIREALLPTLDRMGDKDCVANPDACVAALTASTCDGLADLWRPSIAPPPTPPTMPGWVRIIADRMAAQTTACLQGERGTPASDEERETIAWHTQTMWAQLLSSPPATCTMNDAKATACAEALFGQGCDALAGALGGIDGAGLNGMEACEPLATCIALPAGMEGLTNGQGMDQLDELGK